MKKLICFIFFSLSSTAFASQINLICQNEKFLGMSDGKMSNVSGSWSYEAVLGDDWVVAMMSGDVTCSLGKGYFTNSEFETNCERKLDNGDTLQSYLLINRFNGEFSKNFVINNKLLSVTYGSCSKAKQKF